MRQSDNQNQKTMKTRAVTWIAVLALAGVCVGQQSPEQKKYIEDYDKSEDRVIAAYPDAAIAGSPFNTKMVELYNAMVATEDPHLNSADRPMILAERAAKELGVVAVKTLAAEPDMVKPPGYDHFIPKAFKYENEVIPEFHSYKSVRVRKVEPDGLKIIHESGAAKIEIENLTAEQRLKYGITMEGAAQYRKQVAANTAAYYANQRVAAIQAKADAEATAQAAAEKAAAEQEAQNRVNQPAVQAPVWERFVTNSVATQNNRQNVADEIRRQDGDAAAVRFVTEERLKDLEEAQVDREKVVSLESGKYRRTGDRITVGIDITGGYRIKGNMLYSYPSGAPTHTRSGSLWVPLNSSHPQIRDPER
jgi:hypothetical protein